MLRTVVDANVPHAAAAFGRFGPVRTLPGRAITRDALRDAGALVVRSVTPVDAALLDGTPVRFVGTATAGVDHVDRAALDGLGVAFASAPGSNAASVADSVIASLLALAADRGEGLEGKTLAVVGVGEVGGRVVPRARALGMRVLAVDPPRAAAGFEDHPYVALADALAAADAVTLHTPLTTAAESDHPTLGLVDADAARRMRPGAWLVNAARGRVVTAEAAAWLAGTRPVALDVWPEEPRPVPALIDAVALATPHIAGYALDAKVRGTAMVVDALTAWLRSEGTDVAAWDASAALPAGPVVDAPDLAHGTAAERARWLDALARRVYDVRADDARFRAALAGTTGEARPTAFAALRKDYPLRRELATATVRGPVPAAVAEAVTAGLGMAIE